MLLAPAFALAGNGLQSRGIPSPAMTEAHAATEVADKVSQPERKTRPRYKLSPNTKLKAEFKAQAGILHTAMGKRIPSAEPVAEPNDRSARMAECRQQIQSVLQPSRLIKLVDECERDFPASQFAVEIRHIAAAARQALDIQRSTGLSGDFFEEAIGDEAYRTNLGKAVRGDKDAAYSLALAYRAGISGVAANPRRMEQWLRFAAELGSGAASWELAEFYNYGGFVADAARFEKKALDQGYRPPFRLPTRGY
ncbi:MAG: hypothetical protein M0Z99_03010 [Betaproteobacteria bacterium]|nr:hypothetical protein [Betaproteobacteria bacterium]